MSGFILCQVKQAENPYFIENISTNIYSIEELCYYFCHNLYLIDETIMNEQLCEWIREELGLSGLSGRLRAIWERAGGIDEFVYPVFKEINYLNYEELKTLSARLQRLAKEPVTVREKRKGDSLVENGMYVRALGIYRSVLEREDVSRMREGFTGVVWYNMGCTYSYLFQKERALECFEKAYQQLHTKNTLKSYLLTFSEVYEEEEYVRKLKELGVDARTRQEIQAVRTELGRLPKAAVKDGQVEETLERLTKEYQRNTGA